MSSVPAGDAGDALERLQDEQQHILELFDRYFRYQRDASHPSPQAVRVAGLIATLLRVHCELQEALLQPALQGEAGSEAVLARAATRRAALLDAVDRTETMSPRDPGRAQAMKLLAARVRECFEADENEMFALARRSRLDLAALDRKMAALQELLLSAGRNGSANAVVRAGAGR